MRHHALIRALVAEIRRLRQGATQTDSIEALIKNQGKKRWWTDT